MTEKNEVIQALQEDVAELASFLEEKKEQLSVSFFSHVYDQLDLIKNQVAKLEGVLIEDSTEQLRILLTNVREELQSPTPTLSHVESQEEQKNEEPPAEVAQEVVAEEEKQHTPEIVEPVTREAEEKPEATIAYKEPFKQEKSQTVHEVYEKRRLSSLSQSFSISDRFRYGVLFNNHTEQMKELLTIFETFTTIDEALSYVDKNLDWELTEQPAKDFIELLKKYYS